MPCCVYGIAGLGMEYGIPHTDANCIDTGHRGPVAIDTGGHGGNCEDKWPKAEVAEADKPGRHSWCSIRPFGLWRDLRGRLERDEDKDELELLTYWFWSTMLHVDYATPIR